MLKEKMQVGLVTVIGYVTVKYNGYGHITTQIKGESIRTKDNSYEKMCRNANRHQEKNTQSQTTSKL